MKFKDKNILILIGIFIFSLPLLQPWVRGDGINYYAYIRSLIIDKDLQFGNEFNDAIELDKLAPPVLRGIKEYIPSERLGVGESLLPLTKTGYVRNRMSVGTPLLWSPFFIFAHLLVIIFNKFSIGIPADGYSFPYIFLVSFGSCLYGLVGLILAYKICCRYFSNAISLGATIAIWWASPLPAYMYGHPMLSHTGSVFCASLILFLFLKTEENPSSVRWLCLGFAAGLTMIVRLQDALFLLLPITGFFRNYFTAVKKRDTKVFTKLLKHNSIFLVGLFLGLLPQLIAGKVIYGVWALDFYRQMQDEIAFNWFSPPIVKVLFSSWHGLFSWTPILFFAVIGLYFFFQKDKLLAGILSVIFLFQLYVNSALYSKLTGVYAYQYSSFGGRMFLSCAPIFILGLGGLAEALRPKIHRSLLALSAAFLILWNLGFILQFGLGLIPREGHISWRAVAYNQFVTIPSLICRKICR